MEQELAISRIVTLCKNIHTLKLNIESEQKYLEQLELCLHTAKRRYKERESLLRRATEQVKKYVAAKDKMPESKQNKKWTFVVERAKNCQKTAEVNFINALQNYLELLVKYQIENKKHSELLQELMRKYEEKLKPSRAHFFYMPSNSSTPTATLEGIAQAKEDFQNSIYSLPSL